MITAIVPARSGSKRLAGKNIKLLAGRPLIFYTLDALVDQDLIPEVLFTTDSEEYLELVKNEYGNKVRCILRPTAFARDTSKVYDEVRRLFADGEVKTDWYMLCLPTCPLRNNEVVSSIIRRWEMKQEPQFTGVEYSFPVQFAFKVDNETRWIPLFDESPMMTGKTRSQDIPMMYRPNGAVYLQRKRNLNQPSIYTNAKFFAMSKEQSIDVDTELDLRICELIISSMKDE